MGKRSKCTTTTDEDTDHKSSSKIINKKIKYEECAESDKIEPTATSSKETKAKTKKQKSKSLAKNKKNEDNSGSIEAQNNSSKEVSNMINTDEVEASSDNKKKRKPKHKGLSQNDEEEVKEADIDQFCDELTEEDNVQYENWVELIEAKLHSNKKKPT